MAQKNMDDFSGQNLLELRTRAKLSRRELLERLEEHGVKMHQTTLRRLEDGEQGMKVSEAVAFAAVFGVDVGKFVTEPVNEFDAVIRSYLNSAKTFEELIHRNAEDWFGITNEMKEMLLSPDMPPESQSKAARDLRAYLESSNELRMWLYDSPMKLEGVIGSGARPTGD